MDPFGNVGALVAAIAVVAAAGIGLVAARRPVQRRLEARLHDVPARVVAPPLPAARAGSARPDGWVTTLRYEVDGRVWERVIQLDEELEAGATTVLRYDVRAPQRSHPVPRAPAAGEQRRGRWWPGLLADLVVAALLGVFAWASSWR